MSDTEIEELESRVEQLEEQGQNENQSQLPLVNTSRRNVLASLGLAGASALGGAGLGAERASAQTGSGTLAGFDQIGTSDNRIGAMYVDDLHQNTDHIEAESVITERTDITGDETVTINVPSDEGTLQNALGVASEINLADGTEIVINIESGHEIQQGQIIDGQDCRHVKITSDDDIVPTSNLGSDESLFEIRSSFAPTLECLIDMGSEGDRGMLAYDSNVIVLEGCGIQNAGFSGLETRRTYVTASGADFSGSGHRGYMITRSSIADLQDSVATDCSGDGLFISRGSHVNARHGVFDNAGRHGARVGRSFAVLQQMSATGASDRGISAFGSFIYADQATLDGAGDAGIQIEAGTTISARGSSMEGLTGNRGVRIWRGSRADLGSATIEGAGFRGCAVEGGSFVNLNGSSVTNSDSNDIAIEDGGLINANGCETTNSTGSDPHENDLNADTNGITSSGIIFGDMETE